MAEESLKILLVEDVSEDAELIQVELKKAGLDFLCTVVDTREDVHNQLEHFTPDVVISDFNLPDLSGLDVIDMVKKTAPHVPVIIATGSISEVTAVSCMKVGAADYVLKEFLYKLGPAVNTALDRMRTRVEKNRAEEEIKKSRESLARAQEIAKLGSWDWNLEEDILEWSDEVYRIFGLEPKKSNATYETFLASVHPDDRKDVKDAVERVFADPHENYSIEHRLTRPDGSERVVHGQAEVQFNDKGKPVHMIGTIQDITDRKQLEKQIRESMKLESLGVLTGGIAHEFNNLLLGIMGNAKLALMDIQDGSPASDKILKIEHTAKRAADLTKQMLAYSGKGIFPARQMNISFQINEIKQVLRSVVGGSAKLNFHLQDDIPHIEADSTQINQIVLNLALNAFEAMMDKSGTIDVRTGVKDCDRAFLSSTFIDDGLKEGKYVFLEVADDGEGIKSELLTKIFEPFFSTKDSGSGMGLSAVLGIIRKHMGAVEVKSNAGSGTTIRVFFPSLEDEIDFTSAEPEEVELSLLGGKTLLIEENDTDRLVAEMILKNVVRELETSSNYSEALSTFKKDPEEYELLVVDSSIHNKKTEICIREIKKVRDDVSIILFHEENKEEMQKHYGDSDDIRFIRKPYHPSQLRKKVIDLLR
ncbi:MAG: response regulator [bacterium]